MDWIDINVDRPHHGQKVITLDSSGRWFNCEYWHWKGSKHPYFKLIGKIWDHDNVTHWKPLIGSKSAQS